MDRSYKHPTRRIFADRWYRFDAYQIKGDFIRPRADARLIPYEPWENFDLPAGRQAIRRPYEPLVKLAEQINVRRSGREVMVDGGWEEHALKWCSQHGLLGLLLHRVEYVILPAREQLHGSILRGKTDARGLRTFTRMNRGWGVSPFRAAPGFDIRPCVFLRKGITELDLEVENLSETWGRYFPDVGEDKREQYDYPTPFTPEFWTQYGEPIVDFLAAVDTFSQAIQNVPLPQRSREVSADRVHALLEGQAVLDALVAPARAMLYHVGSTGYGFGWACHSLLSTYAMMLMQDLSSARVLPCKNPTCRTFFVTKAATAKYCSPTCRGTVQVRKRRDRQAKALKLWRNGRSIAEICKRLRVDADQVKRWIGKAKT